MEGGRGFKEWQKAGGCEAQISARLSSSLGSVCPGGGWEVCRSRDPALTNKVRHCVSFCMLKRQIQVAGFHQVTKC